MERPAAIKFPQENGGGAASRRTEASLAAVCRHHHAGLHGNSYNTTLSLVHFSLLVLRPPLTTCLFSFLTSINTWRPPRLNSAALYESTEEEEEGPTFISSYQFGVQRAFL